MEEQQTETETQELWKESNRYRNPVFTEGKQTETETQYFVEGEQTETETKHLHQESEQRQKPSIWRRKVNRDRNPTLKKEE
jgi:hypothetical protein